MTIKLSHEPAVFLLVDAGATHARALVCNSRGAALGHGSGGPANAFAVGDRAAWANLLVSIRKALAAAHARRENIDVAVVGSASVDHSGHGSALIESNLRLFLRRADVRVVADALIALEGSLMGGPGVVVVSGTGSIVLGKTAQNEIAKIGGWGPLLGDEGSAQWVGRQTLQAAARATDGAGPPTSLVRALRRHFRIHSFEQIIDVVYEHPWTPAELGVLAPLAARAAQHGDAVAIEIFRCGGQALGIQAAEAVRRLRLKRAKVSYQGAMFSVGALLLDPLRISLRRHAPGSRLVEPVLPPIGGAFLLAIAATGSAPATAAITAFQRNCHV
ncbi:MAG: BadF/BadG/BcrA/BcrD ATPase family protein [Terriglobia bacterium]